MIFYIIFRCLYYGEYMPLNFFTFVSLIMLDTALGNLRKIYWMHAYLQLLRKGRTLQHNIPILLSLYQFILLQLYKNCNFGTMLNSLFFPLKNL